MNERSVRELNIEAIKDGIMLPDGESLRKDFSLKLGESLTGSEQRAYTTLHHMSLQRPVKTLEFYKTFYGCDAQNDYEANAMRVLIRAIKNKLGEEEIITTKLGYITRTSINQRMVNEKLKLQSP